MSVKIREEAYRSDIPKREEPMMTFNNRPSVWFCVKQLVWETVCEYFSPLTGWKRPEAGYSKKRLP